MSSNISGTLEINCSTNACKKVIEQTKNIAGVDSFFAVDKKSKQEPDLIINVSGMNEVRINEIVQRYINPIKGVINVTYDIGKSLIY